jgi:hypothetical protein
VSRLWAADEANCTTAVDTSGFHRNVLRVVNDMGLRSESESDHGPFVLDIVLKPRCGVCSHDRGGLASSTTPPHVRVPRLCWSPFRSVA